MSDFKTYLGNLTPIDSWGEDGDISGLLEFTLDGPDFVDLGTACGLDEGQIPPNATLAIIQPLSWSYTDVIPQQPLASLFYSGSPSVASGYGLALIGHGYLPVIGRKAIRQLRLSMGVSGGECSGRVQYYTGAVGLLPMPFFNPADVTINIAISNEG